MKKAALLLIGTAMVSCTVHQAKTQEILSKKGCMLFDTSDGYIFLKVSINGQPQRMLFDSGAPFSTVSDAAIAKDLHKKGTASINAGRKILAQKNIAVKMESQLFESNNKIVALQSMPKSKCEQTPLDGIIGTDCFFQNGDPLFLNFTDGKICNIDQAEVQNRLATKAYREVKSKCSLHSVFVYLTVAGELYPFKLDTGYSGQILMPSGKVPHLENYNKMQLQGSVHASATSTANGMETCYEKVPTRLAGHQILANPIVSETFGSHVIGIQFIKGFDWIIDYSKNKVYIRRNHLKIEEKFSRKVSYHARAAEKLTIAVKEKKQTKYNLGDEIVSVNGQKVTAENSCELKDFLNKTADWDVLDLQVVPAIQ